MLVMGIDPGTSSTGFGLVLGKGERLEAVSYGCIETPPGLDLAERLREIFGELGSLIDHYRPDLVAIEQIFLGKNSRTALAVGQARGVALLAAAMAGIPVRTYSPLEVKMAVVGFGRAGKEQVQFMIKSLLSLPALPQPDHAADALAAAICCLHNEEGKALLGGRG